MLFVSQELANFNNNQLHEDNVKLDAKLFDNNLSYWIGTIRGPTGTEYEGGIFHLAIVIDELYPFSPPLVSAV